MRKRKRKYLEFLLIVVPAPSDERAWVLEMLHVISMQNLPNALLNWNTKFFVTKYIHMLQKTSTNRPFKRIILFHNSFKYPIQKPVNTETDLNPSNSQKTYEYLKTLTQCFQSFQVLLLLKLLKLPEQINLAVHNTYQIPPKKAAKKNWRETKDMPCPDRGNSYRK